MIFVQGEREIVIRGTRHPSRPMTIPMQRPTLGVSEFRLKTVRLCALAPWRTYELDVAETWAANTESRHAQPAGEETES